MRSVLVMVSLQWAMVGAEVRPGGRASSQVGAEEEEAEGEGLVLLPLLLYWERAGHEEQVGPPESESDWRGVAEEVLCCVGLYWRVSRVRVEEEGAARRDPSSDLVVVGWPRGQEGAEEEEEGLGCLWTVPGWGAEVPSGRVEVGESGRLSWAQEGGAPVCRGEGEGNYLC